MKLHSDPERHQCPKCESSFVSKGSLMRHMTSHSNERPYLCPYCHKTFKENAGCKKHMKTHKHELAMEAIRSGGANLRVDSEQAFLTAKTRGGFSHQLPSQPPPSHTETPSVMVSNEQVD